MNISLNQFVAIRSGTLKIDSQNPDTLVSKGTGLGGKIVTWIRSIVDRDGVCTENKNVMASFIAAIKESRDYAGEIGERLKGWNGPWHRENR